MASSSRDDFTEKTKQQLCSRVGQRCSLPDCDAPTSGPSDESSSAVNNVGVAAHICGAAPGPGSRRYDPNMTSAERSSIENGIWLCCTHARQIDNDDRTWTVAKLKEIKAAAEKRQQARLGQQQHTRGPADAVAATSHHFPAGKASALKTRAAVGIALAMSIGALLYGYASTERAQTLAAHLNALPVDLFSPDLSPILKVPLPLPNGFSPTATIDKIVSLGSSPFREEVGTGYRSILGDQWAAVVNTHRSGLLSYSSSPNGSRCGELNRGLEQLRTSSALDRFLLSRLISKPDLQRIVQENALPCQVVGNADFRELAAASVLAEHDRRRCRMLGADFRCSGSSYADLVSDSGWQELLGWLGVPPVFSALEIGGRIQIGACDQTVRQVAVLAQDGEILLRMAVTISQNIPLNRSCAIASFKGNDGLIVGVALTPTAQLVGYRFDNMRVALRPLGDAREWMEREREIVVRFPLDKREIFPTTADTSATQLGGPLFLGSSMDFEPWLELAPNGFCPSMSTFWHYSGNYLAFLGWPVATTMRGGEFWGPSVNRMVGTVCNGRPCPQERVVIASADLPGHLMIDRDVVRIISGLSIDDAGVASFFYTGDPDCSLLLTSSRSSAFLPAAIHKADRASTAITGGDFGTSIEARCSSGGKVRVGGFQIERGRVAPSALLFQGRGLQCRQDTVANVSIPEKRLFWPVMLPSLRSNSARRASSE